MMEKEEPLHVKQMDIGITNQLVQVEIFVFIWQFVIWSLFDLN